MRLLDAGARGYYLGWRPHWSRNHLDHALLPLWGSTALRDAVDGCKALRRSCTTGFVVADCKDTIPFARVAGSRAQHLSTAQSAEFARVLAPGGLLLTVIPSPTICVSCAIGWTCWLEENKLQHLRAALLEQFAS